MTGAERRAGRPQVRQLLADLDGVQHDNKHVLVIGTTHSPWNVDSALRRPGRFDRTIFVPPDRDARETILLLALRGRPCGPDLDLGALATRSRAYSRADLVGVVPRATDLAMKGALAACRACPIAQNHLEQALALTPASIGDWLEIATPGTPMTAGPTTRSAPT